MPKVRVVRATQRELQSSMRARDYVSRPASRKPPAKKEPEVMQRHPLRHLREEGAQS